MGKDASLESMRVAIRKCESAVQAVVGLPARLAGLERRVQALDNAVRVLTGRPLRAVPPLPSLAELEGIGSPPEAPDAEPSPTAPLTTAALQSMFAQLGRELAAGLREALQPTEVPPPLVRAPREPRGPLDLSDIGVTPDSVVSYEQTRG